MHIVHLTPYYAPAYAFGGVVSMVEGLAQAQVRRGHTVTVLTTNAGTLSAPVQAPADEDRDGVRVVRVRNWVYPLRRFNLSTPLTLSAQAASVLAQADVLHAHEFRTVENQLLLPQAQSPVILSPHGTLTYSTGRSAVKQLWDRWLSPRIATHVDHVLALADAERDDVRTVWQQWDSPVPPITVIPNGVNLAEFDALPDGAAFRARYAPHADQIVLFMGRLHKRKGVDLLAQAFMQAEIAGAVLVIAGPDEGMAATLTAHDPARVVLTGYLDRQTRLAALAAADLFALPATGEGLSMAVLEALAAGVPVLLSPGCNLPQAEASGAGQIVPVEREAWANALTAILGDDAQRQQMAHNARQLAAQHFAWESIAARIEAVYAKP